MPAPKDPKKYKLWKERTGQASRRRWQDPDFRKNIIQKIREGWNDPEVRQRRREQTIKQWKNPDFQKLMREMKIEHYNDIYYTIFQVWEKGFGPNPGRKIVYTKKEKGTT